MTLLTSLLFSIRFIHLLFYISLSLCVATGFSTSGAAAPQVHLMRCVVGGFCGVKASGGIRDAAGAQKMVDAGANRLGCSASVAIAEGGKHAPATPAAAAAHGQDSGKY